MIDPGWQDFFPDYILERGEDYAISGHVRDLMVGEDRITANVLGSSVYRVSIDLKNGMPIKMVKLLSRISKITSAQRWELR